MKNLIKLTSLLVFITLFACTKEEQKVPTELIGEELIEVNDLKVGDRFQFSLFLGESYFDANNQDFEYTNDFLNVEIIEELSNGFKVKEWIDVSSNMFTSTETYYYQDKDAIFYNTWTIENDKLSIESQIDDYLSSHLFLDGYTKVELPLDKFNGEEIEITSWKTDRPFSESDSEYFVTDYELLGIEYAHLNVLVQDGPMASDGNGNTYIYNKDAGIVRSVTYSAWTGKGIGWDRIK